MRKRGEIIEAHKNGNILSTCKGCRNLIEADWTEKNYPFDVISIQNDLRCNVRCEYCNFIFKYSDENLFDHVGSSYPIIPILQELCEKKFLFPYSQVFFAGGEPTLLKGFADCIRNLLSYSPFIQLQIATNATIIPDGFLDVCNEYGNQITILTSLDSGSRDIYKAVKKYDYYEDVIKNLSLYKKYVKSVKLKFIIIHSNIADIENFFIAAQTLGVTDVICDLDCTQDMKQLPKEILDSVARFIFASYQYKMNMSFGSAWEFYDITQNQIETAKSAYFDNHIKTTALNTQTGIILSIAGKNEEAFASEAILLNVWSDKQPIWNTLEGIAGNYTLKDDINAPRKALCLTDVDSWAEISINIEENDCLYLQALCSKWSGILKVNIFNKSRQVDLYSEEPERKIIKIGD